ncbi:hypothetical protein MMC21_000217 [Puttea exsequens]|nr:hypothetical protein [Puttea exsequens]
MAMTKSALPLPPSSAKSTEDEGEEDDYMSMTIAEPATPIQKETYTQRRIRKKREAEARAHPKSKAQLAADADAAREDGLAKALDNKSKGFQMMAKLGFKPGEALGKAENPNARTEPLGIAMKENRSGVGMENEKKRKLREDMERVLGAEKRQKAEEGDYRVRVAREREAKRVEGRFWGAMRVLEGLEQPEGKSSMSSRRVNVLWRGLVMEREQKERERRTRYDLAQSLSKNATYNDSEEDEQDRQALGKEEADVEEEDEELDEFMALEGSERLRRLVGYLREKHFYCFWCKFQYEDEGMDGCPGLTEDEHG